MIVKGTYFQNDAERPLVYGDVEIRNIPRQRLRGEKEKDEMCIRDRFKERYKISPSDYRSTCVKEMLS